MTDPKTQPGVTPIKTGKGPLLLRDTTVGVQPVMPTVEPITIGNGPSLLPVTAPGVKSTKPDRGPSVAPSVQEPPSRLKKSEEPKIFVEPMKLGKELPQAIGVIAPVKAAPSPPVASIPPPVVPPAWKGIRSGVAIVGRFEPWPWGQCPDEVHLADAVESLGVRVYRIDQYIAHLPLMEAEWALFTADQFSWGRIPEWSSTHKTILWTREWLPGYVERHPIIDAGRRVTLFATSDKFDWKGFGIENHFYFPGACDPVKPPFNPNPTRTCAFLGSIYNRRRFEIAEIVRKLKGEVLDAPELWLYGPKLEKFVQETKVIVGDNARNEMPGYWSWRNYIVPGAGGFLLTAHVPDLGSHFELDRHLCTYSSLKILEKALEVYIAHDAEREEVRRAGFLHVRALHTWTERARSLLVRMGLAHAYKN